MGPKALNLSRTGVDLVVLDVILPDIDGFEVCRRLRSEIDPANRRHPPLVVVRAGYRQSRRARRGGRWISDPAVEPPVLLATVNAFLRAAVGLRETRSANSNSARSSRMRLTASFSSIRNSGWGTSTRHCALSCSGSASS